MNFTGFFCASAVLVALLVAVPPAHSECCGYVYNWPDTNLRYTARCADCTRLDSNNCAASGYCNIFGCNCDGGCRRSVEGRTCSESCCDRSDRKARDVNMAADNGTLDALPALSGSYTGHDVVALADNDRDGRLNETEVLVLIERMRMPIRVVTWRHLDVDQDGFLKAHEIDASLAPSVIQFTVESP